MHTYFIRVVLKNVTMIVQKTHWGMGTKKGVENHG